MSVFVIAEAGVNHNGSVETAKRMIETAAKAGADAVKFQTFRSESLVTKTAERAEYQKRNMPSHKESQFEMLKNLELSYEAFLELKKACDASGIEFMSTPFDDEAVDFLAPLVKRFKVASGDISTVPLLRRIAAHRKPVIVSTGMASVSDIELALDTLESAGAGALHILHCTSNYPCEDHEVNLQAMVTLERIFHKPVGYSDHSSGIVVASAAVALGATVLEKHFTLDKNLPGPDHKASLDSSELSAYVTSARRTAVMLGDGRKRPTVSELAVRQVVRKSLVWLRDAAAGTVVTPQLLGCKRPGSGISAADFDSINGARLTKNVKADTLVALDEISRGREA